MSLSLMPVYTYIILQFGCKINIFILFFIKHRLVYYSDNIILQYRSKSTTVILHKQKVIRYKLF